MAEFNNPYTVLREALAARQAALADEPIPSMLSPDEARERSSKLSRNRMYGEMGMLSRDPGIEGAAKPLLAEAIKASQLKQTEHGEYDPTTGSFREFPSYTRQRKSDLVDKQLQQASALEAGAQARWDEARQRAREDLERQRERLENAKALRAMINASKTPTDPGSVSYVGTDPKTGNPVMNHTKTGLFQVDPATGARVPHVGAVSQKDQGITQTERKNIEDAMNAHEGFGLAIQKLEPLREDKRTTMTTGMLPGALSAMGPTGQAIVQRARPKEFNEAYQLVREFASGLRAGRFGLTLTPAEMADSIKYLPSDTDNVDDLIWKAQGLQNIIELKMKNTATVINKPGLPSRVPPMPGTDPNAGVKTPYDNDPEKRARFLKYKAEKEAREAQQP